MSEVHETDPAFPTWDDDTVDELRAYGSERAVSAGEVLLQPGRRSEGFFVVLDGEVEVIQPDAPATPSPGRRGGAGPVRGAVQPPGRQRPYLTVRAARAGECSPSRPTGSGDLMGSRRRIATAIFESITARTESQRTGPAAQTVRIIGSRFSPESLALRAFVTRSRVPHTWVDLDEADDPDLVLAGLGLGADDVPAVVPPTARCATPRRARSPSGWGSPSTPHRATRSTSRGRRRAGRPGRRRLRRRRGARHGRARCARGRRAGRHELADRELRRLPQRHLGRRADRPGRDPGPAPRRPHQRALPVAGLRPERWVPHAGAGRRQRGPRPRASSSPPARTTGGCRCPSSTATRAPASTTPPPASRRGTAATTPVVVVGGGNSAGQAALYLAEQGSRVSIVIRRRGLAARHVALPDRAGSRPTRASRCCTRTEVGRSRASGHLERSRSSTRRPARERTVSCAGLFCFIGAEPATDWLDGAVALDDQASCSPTGPSPSRARKDPRSPPGRRCPTRRRCPGCSPSATCAAVRSSGWPRRSARDRDRCARCSITCR